MVCHILQSKFSWRSKLTLILFLFCHQIGFSGVGRFTWCQGSGLAPSPAPSPNLCPMWMQLTKWLRGAQPTSLKVCWRSCQERSGGVQDTVCLEHPEPSVFGSDHRAVPAIPAPQSGDETSLYRIVTLTAVTVTIKLFQSQRCSPVRLGDKQVSGKLETRSLPRPATLLPRPLLWVTWYSLLRASNSQKSAWKPQQSSTSLWEHRDTWTLSPALYYLSALGNLSNCSASSFLPVQNSYSNNNLEDVTVASQWKLSSKC